MERLTSRERPKSAPYLRIKNSKRTSVSSILFYSIRMRKKLKKIRFFWSPVSHIVPKNVKKEGSLEVFEHPFFCRIEKNEGGPFADIEKICEKKVSRPKKTLHKKFLVKGGTRTHVLLLRRPQKSRNLYAKCQ